MALLGQGWDDPQSAAIMALAGGLLQGNFGGGLLGANQAFAQAKQLAAEAEDRKLRQRKGLLELEELERNAGVQRKLEDAARQSYRSPEMAQAMSMGPMPDGNAVPQVAPGFDPRAFLGKAYGIDPFRAMQLEQSLNKTEAPIKVGAGDTLINPRTMQPMFTAPEKKAATPASIQEYEYARQQGFRGSLADYEMAKRRAGASSVSVTQVAETEWSKKRAGDFAEMMAGINKTSFSAPTQVRKLERMEQLLQGVDGGKLAPTGLEIASAANSLGIKMDPRLGNKEAAQALSREIAAGFRQPGTGPMTDKDFDNFLLQVPDLSKTAEGRKQITATMKAAAARDIEIGRRARDYVKRNGRLDDNFVDEIAQFIAENPVVQLPKTWRVQR